MKSNCRVCITGKSSPRLVRQWQVVVLLGVGLFSSCEREQKEVAAEVAAVEEALPVVGEDAEPATYLGFASHLPKDTDLYLVGMDGDQMVESLFDSLLATGLAVRGEMASEVDDGGGAQDSGLDEELAALDESSGLKETIIPYVGDETFMFVRGGIGEQLKTLTQLNRDLTATTTGSMVDALMESLESGESPDELDENEFGESLVRGVLDMIEKDSRLLLPSVVMGFKPYPEKQQECLDGAREILKEWVEGSSEMKPVSFEHHGAIMNGYQLGGREVFEEIITGLREELANGEGGEELTLSISDTDQEQLLAALENFHFTFACGNLEGYVLIYMGNGTEGFQLAESAENSLAATSDVKWTTSFSEHRILSYAYLSESVLKGFLPLLDGSHNWQAVAAAMEPKLQGYRVIHGLISEMATMEKELAKRQASAWSAVLVEDEGWRIETRGGWPDPGLDYETPHQMTDAAIAAKPAARMHWVQNRERNDLKWSRIQLFGTMFEVGLQKYFSINDGGEGLVNEELVEFVIEQVRRLNSAYRDEFRNGIGDEVALVCDLRGMTPPIPGISDEVVAEMKLPRLIVARPVTDPELLRQSGESFVDLWKSTIYEVNERFDLSLPPLLPQSIESNELTTWYFPLGVTGGDFIPGVASNDSVWMATTSRSMADDFSKALKTGSTNRETGVIAVVDFEAFWEWIAESYALNTSDLDAMLQQGAFGADIQDAQDRMWEGIQRLKSYRYRHWVYDGIPRSSHHFVIAPAESER